MKRIVVTNSLLVLGIILVCVAVVLSLVATNDKDIVGGADFHTFVFVFFREHRGIYFLLAVLGVVSIAASVIAHILKRDKKGER